MTDTPQSQISPKYASPRNAFWGGVREAASVPMMIMGASFVGFGSMMNGMDWSIGHALYSTFSTWALPGQIAMAEMATSGAPLMAIVLAVTFINARLLPMVASLLPQVRHPGIPTWAYYASALLIAATSWVGTMRRMPDLLPEQRFAFMIGYGLLLYLSSPIFTFIGYQLSDSVPVPVTLALVFLNPLYFMVLFLVDLRSRTKVLALAIGIILGPLSYLYFPDWSLIATGLIGGTLAWVIARYIPAKGNA